MAGGIGLHGEAQHNAEAASGRNLQVASQHGCIQRVEDWRESFLVDAR